MLLRVAAGEVPGLTIRSFHPFCYDSARAHGLDVLPMDRDARSANYWEYELPEVLLQALERGLERFDAVVVDEGQDFADAWWLVLQQCLAKPERGVLYAFLDPHQRLYDRECSFVDGLPTYSLTANLRNSQAIHALAQSFYAGDCLRPAGPPGRSPEVIILKAGQSLGESLERLLRRLIDQDQVPAEEIAVLTGRRPDRVGLDFADRSRGVSLTNAEHPRTGHVVLDTIHRYKGMDSAVVVLTGLEGMYAPTARTLLYVGLTRARSHPVILERPEVLDHYGLTM